MRKLFVFMVMILLGGVALQACSKEDKVSSISIQAGLLLDINDRQELRVTVVPEILSDRIVAWSSSDEHVVTVDSYGMVTALNIGMAEITATVGGVTSNKCIVVVRGEGLPVTSIKIPEKEQLNLNEIKLLKTVILPEYATDKTIEWTSSAPAVATVRFDGMVTAINSGTTNITATSGGVTSNVCVLTVTANINFKDLNLKEYLVANFDTNGDGEISVSEKDLVETIDDKLIEMSGFDDLVYFGNLKSFLCPNRKRQKLDISQNTLLTKFDCSDNWLSILDISKNIALTELDCSHNSLATLDVSKNIGLSELNCFGNRLTTLDVSKNIGLSELNCSKNKLTALDCSKNSVLTKLICDYNPLTSLDVSKNTELTTLVCSGSFTTLDLSKNVNLTELSYVNSSLTTLDLSANTKLAKLVCFSSQPITITIKKGQNIEIEKNLYVTIVEK